MDTTAKEENAEVVTPTVGDEKQSGGSKVERRKSQHGEEVDKLLKHLWIASTITHHPFIVFFVTLFAMGILTLIDSFVFDLASQSNRSYLVESDYYVTNYDMVNLAYEASLSSETDIVTEPQSEVESSWTVLIMFELDSYDKEINTNNPSSTDYWILTPSNLETIIKYENKVINDNDWNDYYCYAPNSTSWECNYFSVAYLVYDYFGQNLTGVTTDDIKTYVLLLQNADVTGYVASSFNSEFEDTNQTYLYRSFFYSAGPIPTNITTITSSNKVIKKSKYKNIDDDAETQESEFNDWGEGIWTEVTVDHNANLVVGDLRIVVLIYSVYSEYFNLLLSEAQNYIGFAGVAVILWMTTHLQSFFLSFLSVIQIGLSFPFAYFIYYFIYQISHYDTLSVLIVFVLLGVGADDVFVFTDAWHQSVHFVHDSSDLEQRMTFAYRRASKAMFVTQVTTFFAFLATAFSLIMPISAFGIWAATIVACNYVLVITIYPSLVIIHHCYIEKYEKPILCFLCRKFSEKMSEKKRGNTDQKTSKESNSNNNNDNNKSELLQTKSEIDKNDIELQPKPERITSTSTSASPRPPSPNYKQPRDLVPDTPITPNDDNNESKPTTLEPPHEHYPAGVATTATTTKNDNNNNNNDNDESSTTGGVTHWSITKDVDDYRGIEKFFGVTWGRFVIRFRIIILIFFLGLFSTTVYFATKIEAQDEDEAWFKDTHYMQLVTDLANEFAAGAEDRLVTITIIWGLDDIDRSGTDWFDPDDYGTLEWDNTFDFSSPHAQEYLNESCHNLSHSDLVYSISSVTCPMDLIIAYIEVMNDTFPWTYMDPNDDDYDNETQSYEFSMFLYNFSQTDYATYLLSNDLLYVESPKSYGNNEARIRFIAMEASSDITWDSTVTDAFNTRDEWEDWLNSRFRDNSNCPQGLSNPIQSTLRWAWLRSTLEFVKSAVQGIAIAMPLAFIVLLLSTGNWIMSIFATFDIIGVILCELAVMAILGWQFGVAESVAIVVMIGFSVDYVVHLANAYLECPSPNRHDRISFALLTMGISIVSGAVTTVLTGSFLTIPAIVFFEKMGILILTTILFSVIWAMGFFVALLAQFGPQNDSGNVPFHKILNACRRNKN